MASDTRTGAARAGCGASGSACSDGSCWGDGQCRPWIAQPHRSIRWPRPGSRKAPTVPINRLPQGRRSNQASCRSTARTASGSATSVRPAGRLLRRRLKGNRAVVLQRRLRRRLLPTWRLLERCQRLHLSPALLRLPSMSAAASLRREPSIPWQPPAFSKRRRARIWHQASSLPPLWRRQNKQRDNCLGRRCGIHLGIGLSSRTSRALSARSNTA